MRRRSGSSGLQKSLRSAVLSESVGGRLSPPALLLLPHLDEAAAQPPSFPPKGASESVSVSSRRILLFASSAETRVAKGSHVRPAPSLLVMPS